MDEKQKGKLTFALSIVLLAIGVWIDYNIENLSYPDHTPLIMSYYVYNIIPGVLLLISWILGMLNISIKKYVMKAAVYTVIAGVIINVFMAFFVHTIPVTDSSHLNRIILESGYPNNLAIGHYPIEVPKNAEDAELFYKRQIVKDNWALKIKYKLPLEEFNKVKLDYSLTPRTPMDNSTKNNHVAPLYSEGIPDDLDVLRLGKWSETNAVYGIAFSDSRQEVIYFAYVSQED